MYLKNLVLVALLSLGPLTFAAFGQEAAGHTTRETFATGSDWSERMSVREKLISLIPPTILMHRYGVPMKRPLDDYLPAIDRFLDYHPQLEKEDVANIFTSTVYSDEPESREAIEIMERDLRLRREGYNPAYFPRLLVSQRRDRDVSE